jgi:hypothetical protein
MNTKQAKQLDLPKLMSRLGYEPVKVTKGGNELWYKSPFRQEKDPSFHTSYLGGKWIWNDFGDIGGTVIDFVMRHEGFNQVKDALAFLTSMYQGHLFEKPPTRTRKSQSPSLFSFQQQTSREAASKFSQGQSGDLFLDRDLEFIGDKPLQSPLIFSYLNSRGISREVAIKYLRLVHYRNLKKTSQRPYFGFGQKNVSGGWEVRSATDDPKMKFKSALIARDITVHPGTEQGRGGVSVFEGMLDHLSLLMMFGVKSLRGDALILNGLSSYGRAKAYIAEQGYTQIDLFLDNNNPGRETAQQFAEDFGDIVKDHSSAFAGYTDLNDALRAGFIPSFSPSSPAP